MNPKEWTWTQWVNLATFALGSLALAGWWQAYFSPQTVAFITGGLTWLSGIFNFIVNGPTNTVPKP